MKRFAPSLLVVVTLTLALAQSGCSHFSKTNRQQRAYSNYIRKSSAANTRRGLKFRTAKMQMPAMPQASDPQVSAEAGPQAIPAESSN
ncbi:MAG: hypothetical protein M3Y86_01515 [Verrucomicrobiota bacterium]|nr:hypothetical protein [Verrucomicrobiota bacterium]